ncbi:MAG: adenylyltransferase/cytidyltransferase family protein [Parcubacteria group bacterium]|nr:adenylyltransferase/cytidyltransferase family protein [Parcubacteria group bacterium]
MKIKKKKTVVAVSGGWDPIHVGHVRLFNEAKKLGHELVVILNNDNWLAAKKGYSFMPEQERKEMIEGLRAVDRVVVTAHAPHDPDRSVCRELRKIRPDIFANGGDRDDKDAEKKSSSLNPEQKLCKELGIRMVFNVGNGGKVQSSSWLLEKYSKRINGAGKRAPLV